MSFGFPGTNAVMQQPQSQFFHQQQQQQQQQQPNSTWAKVMQPLSIEHSHVPVPVHVPMPVPTPVSDPFAFNRPIASSTSSVSVTTDETEEIRESSSNMEFRQFVCCTYLFEIFR
jgi:transcription initiation factor TFIID subunit TAF12